MGKLVESTFVTLDGAIDSPQRWSGPYWDDEHAAYARNLLFGADALLLGRGTYEIFAGSWPNRDPNDAMVSRINGMPKYVASRSLRDPTWNATMLEDDVAERVAALKQRQNLLKYGTGELDRTLLAHNLVDEFHFWMFPVLGAGGPRLIEGIDLTHLKLVDLTRFKSGLVVLVYSQ